MNHKNESINIFLVDNHPVVRAGVRSILKKRPDFKITGEAGTGKEALENITEASPDIILLDVNLQDISGTEVIKKVREKIPEIKIIGYSIHNGNEYILEFIRLGASGYLLKNCAPAELIDAIDTVSNGNTYFCSRINENLVKQQLENIKRSKRSFLQEKKLTQRECEVLVRLANGLPNKEIANSLSLSVRTVEAHREHLMHKLGTKNIAGVIKYALVNGFLENETVI